MAPSPRGKVAARPWASARANQKTDRLVSFFLAEGESRGAQRSTKTLPRGNRHCPWAPPVLGLRRDAEGAKGGVLSKRRRALVSHDNLQMNQTNWGGNHEKLAILSAVAAFGVLGFVGPSSASNALELGNNQRLNLFVECEDGGTAGFIDMHVDAERQGGGPKISIPLANCIMNEVQAHELGEGAPETDSLGVGGGTQGVCNTSNNLPLPAIYTIQANCTNVNALPGFVNTIGVEGLFDIRTIHPESGFIGMTFPFHCNIPNNC